MPHRTTGLTGELAAKQKNHSFELLVANWFMLSGWQVFVPLLDSGHATDLLISDGPKYYRIQIKTVETQDENNKVPNRWKGKKIDYVIMFAKNPIGAMSALPLKQMRSESIMKTTKGFFKIANHSWLPFIP